MQELIVKIAKDFQEGLTVCDLSRKYNISKIKVEKIIKKVLTR